MGKLLIIPNADFTSVAIGKVTPITNKVAINVVASPNSGGTVAGGGLYEEGESVTISASPSYGYIFKQWNDGNTNATRSILVGLTPVTYTAQFEEIGKVDLTNDLTQGLWSGTGTDNTEQTITWYGEGDSASAKKYVCTFDGDDMLNSADSPEITIPAGWAFRFLASASRLSKTTAKSGKAYRQNFRSVETTTVFRVSDLYDNANISSSDYPYFILNIYLKGTSEITVEDAIEAGVKVIKREG